MGGELTQKDFDAIRAAAYTKTVPDDHEYGVEPLIRKPPAQQGSRIFTTDAPTRKNHPVFTGTLMYFPDALAALAHVSKMGNDQHNPGEPLHWAREKSTDQMDTATRHMMDHGSGYTKDSDGAYHLAKAAWRILAELQLTIERERETMQTAETPARAEGRKGCDEYGSGDGKHFWGCEREAGHSGNHMAWDNYPLGILYEGGSWK